MAQPSEEILSLIGCALLQNRQQAQRDIEQALQNQRSHLTLKLAEFYFNDGTEKLLLCLSGTIVIDHRGAQYHIPVEFWLHEDHPNSAPICFVKPTRDMSIVRHCPHVEVDGKISFSYLDKWNSRTSRLAILIDDLSVAFGELPPVCSNLSPVLSNRSSACSNGSPVLSNRSSACSNGSPVHPNQSPVSSNRSPVHPNQSPVSSNRSPVHPNQSPVSSNRSPSEPLPYPISVGNGMPQPVLTTSSSSSSYISLPVVVSPAASVARELPQRTVSMNENSDDGLCHICMERSIDCVLIDCGHMVSCTKCAESFKLCPICRKNVIRILKVFK